MQVTFLNKTAYKEELSCLPLWHRKLEEGLKLVVYYFYQELSLVSNSLQTPTSRHSLKCKAFPKIGKVIVIGEESGDPKEQGREKVGV